MGGLSASTTYHYSVYADTAGGIHILGNYGGNVVPSLQEQYQINLDSRIAITPDIYITTPATSGGAPSGGGGGGGSTCPGVDLPLETKELGTVRAGDVRPGMHLRGPDGDWKIVLLAEERDGMMFSTTVGGEMYPTDSNHYWEKADGEFVRVTDLTLDTLLRGSDGGVHLVTGINLIGEGRFMKIGVAGHIFQVGALIAHNTISP